MEESGSENLDIELAKRKDTFLKVKFLDKDHYGDFIYLWSN